jgi:ketosteroid isomerase-like protein
MTTRDEIRQFNAKLSEAAARGDAGALAAMYDDEACFVVAGSPTFKGAGQIAALCDEFLSDGPAKIAFEPGDIWESERLVVTVGTLTVGDNPDERCVVVYRRRADSSLAILVDAPIRESRR